MSHSCTIYGDPVGKPRMTKRDVWKQRPCVMRYRAWCDLARLAAFKKNSKLTLARPTTLIIKAFMPNGKQHRVGPHTVKPDLDNIGKSVMDALFANDQMVYKLDCQKLWCDGSRPRVELEWW